MHPLLPDALFLVCRADNLRVHMKTHNDPSLLSLSMEKLLAPGVDSSAQPVNEAVATQTHSGAERGPTNGKSPLKTDSQTGEAKVLNKADKTAAQLGNFVDGAFGVPQDAQIHMQNAVTANNQFSAPEQPERSDAQTFTVPPSGFQIVATAGGSGAALVPIVQTANDQSKFANMETISASAVMLMTNYFQSTNNSQQ